MSLHLATDRELIDSYLSGNHSSFEVLLHRHKNIVYAYIVMTVKDRHLAEDIFQDTFIRVVNSIRSGCYKDQGKFLCWVMHIAHNIALDHFRKANTIPIFIPYKEGEDIFDKFHIDEHSAEEQIIIDQSHQIMKALLECLTPKQKEVLVMRHYYDMSYKEIAKNIDENIDTVKSLIRRGRIMLKQINRQKNLL